MELFRNFSYRLKIPLAITVVILLTEIVVTAALITRAFGDARRDLNSSAQNLARVLTRSVRDPLLRDDLWHTYEVIRTPVAAKDPLNPLKDIVVVDRLKRVYAATDPTRFPVLAGQNELPAVFRKALDALDRGKDTFFFDFPGVRSANDVTAGMRLQSEDGSVLGYVLLAYDATVLYNRIRSVLLEIALISVPGLLLLVPLGWLWGKRMAEPLIRLSVAMGRVGKDPAGEIMDEISVSGRDEIGQLGGQFRTMLQDLADKQSLEKQVVASERLAAVGRVAAGVAHEISNPLGGMINAVDTLVKHGNPDPFTQKTLGLLERGLSQIRTTVRALLVEARLDSSAMAPSDWQDLRTLIQPEVEQRTAMLDWRVTVDQFIELPAHLIRQLVLNLLLNSAKAVERGGRMSCDASLEQSELVVTVFNTGEHIPDSMMQHLFEPFNVATQNGGRRSFGLGLWVTYQIVTQLDGTITVESEPGSTEFRVRIPIPQS